MTIITNTQYLQIDAASVFDHFFVLAAMQLYIFFFYFTIRNMNVFGFDINMVKKIGFHEAVIALQCIIVDRVIFIEVKRHNIFKTQLFFFMHSYQLGI